MRWYGVVTIFVWTLKQDCGRKSNETQEMITIRDNVATIKIWYKYQRKLQSCNFPFQW